MYWPFFKAWRHLPSTERTPLVSQLLKGHVDLAHPHALPLVGRLSPVLAHGGGLGPGVGEETIVTTMEY